ncbi:tRNA(Met) cytidine acetyltransferase [Shimwellia pseudoproteus]|uniref:tRNA(Met) cytidine acetyltransferase TmcA n=1 Tax=Shimwellia pseudoproteus TaxID=570012 RepID=UPI0018EE016A|nr:GNAT family N-acetyltransferase [Shimwellia pseudoproteus]MBJ3815114.1 tRNA(Met) cytidine acetyltransferase [Shimwellia pseudoproteus]
MDDRAIVSTLCATAQTMAHSGCRRLLVVSGEPDWSLHCVGQLIDALAGDWLWMGPAPQRGYYCPPRQMRSVLGREFRHGVFDARSGLDVEALAAMSGTLTAGSWLVLLIPPLPRWPLLPDSDSVRWSDTPGPIATPCFIHHAIRTLLNDPEVVFWSPAGLQYRDAPARPPWYPASGAPAAGQAAILAQLQDMRRGVAVITAPRGRGKSALAGMLLRAWSGPVLVSAPAKVAVDVLARHGGDKFQFIAPDALLAALDNGTAPEADWLIIDEAAAIPGPLLTRLIAAYPRTLLTTTVQGYEGTGRGFLLKFCAAIPDLQHFVLDIPLRWCASDPLERVIGQMLLFDDHASVAPVSGPLTITPADRRHWLADSREAASLYALLCGAHYRTSPLDLRRMMDAPAQYFMAARHAGVVGGAAWLVREGGLTAALSQAVWAGYRRPRGNLVAQSLAAHGGSPLAATLRGLRITRIAVTPTRQGQGLGQKLVAAARHTWGDEVDYLSVSFGYTPQLWRFWARCGFTLVRIGSHREASSGCYNAMALLPVSSAGQVMADHEHRRLCADWPWLRPWIDESLALSGPSGTTLTSDDALELAGFAFAHRPLEACLGSLGRLLATLPGMPVLRSRLEQQCGDEAICRQFRLAGRKALLCRWREEVAEALSAQDPEMAAQRRQQILQLQFFN